MHDLEQFLDKKYCETRQRDGINRYDSKDLSASDEVLSSLDRSTKYETFENSPSSVFYIDIDAKFDNIIYCENCRQGFGRWFYKISNRSNRIKAKKEEVKAKTEIIDHLFTLQLSLRDEQNFSSLDNEAFSATAARRDHVLQKIVNLNEKMRFK